MRLEKFLRENVVIDTSLQKGFSQASMTRWNTSSLIVSSIVQNAIQHGLPLALTFLNLENIFGSISHQLILDMMTHCRIPPEITNYIMSLYSNLTGYVKTRKWSIDVFMIGKGVFQGDSLSPLIFLVAFNPIIQLAESLPTCGFQLRLPTGTPETPQGTKC